MLLQFKQQLFVRSLFIAEVVRFEYKQIFGFLLSTKSRQRRSH
ncbi:MAG: hypothetical protein RMY64_34180 [Nostoc sp. DedQUE08]|nr:MULTISPECIES: hypothetical protein [unclassified Nostoc]MDZ8070602.1 hypothetical protein [Nostoc sp. DedQUE08]MDZ8092723.1 hypothetical protein [Nostoc sp. DedQUE05]